MSSPIFPASKGRDLWEKRPSLNIYICVFSAESLQFFSEFILFAIEDSFVDQTIVNNRQRFQNDLNLKSVYHFIGEADFISSYKIGTCRNVGSYINFAWKFAI